MSKTVKRCVCSPGERINMIRYDKNPKSRQYNIDYLCYEWLWLYNDIDKESWVMDFDNNICPFCKNSLFDTQITFNDYNVLGDISDYNKDLLEAMIKLRQTDVIEFETKMVPFRQLKSQQEQTHQAKQSMPSNQPKCPRCKSTAITAGQRGYSIMWGFWGSGDTVNRCSNCGHKWKPGK